MTITKDTFEKIDNKVFEIAFSSEQATNCELIEIKVNKNIPIREGQIEPFSLVFQASGDTIFDQDIYMVKNEELQETPLFLVPIGSDEKGVRYEAIFN